MNDLRIIRLEDYGLQIQPKSRANTAATDIDEDTVLTDVVTVEHDRGVTTTAARRTEPPPAGFLPTWK